ncbi:MAG: methylenetetrahydrofolate reductase C-terminal domain-containing protein [Desulfamplus sp.]|nr:methylenetetrahydrofolate reductase C-terminal domain-containing protein [Desulfamplus sp.]
MIKIKEKKFEEIVDSIEGFKKILVLGCGGCASVCLGGGQKEAECLCVNLNLFFKSETSSRTARGYTIERQCNIAFIEETCSFITQFDAVLSMACGAGSQYMAEIYPGIPVFPAVNTIAIGIDREIGVYEEKCRACGDCVVGYTGGVCPVTRCAKGLFNGPCGGTNKGSCEIDSNIPCAWVDIYNRLKAQDRLGNIMKIRPSMEWQNQTPRTVVQKR